MTISRALMFVTAFIETLDEAVRKHRPDSGLSRIQKGWLAFCVMGILISNSVCRAKFGRASPGKYSSAALSRMFRHSGIPWELLLVMSVRVILGRFGITEGSLVIDDSGKKRSEKTQKISFVHKFKDKDGGFVMGQCVVLLVPVTQLTTIPAGFAFHMPDPEMTAWHKLTKKLRKKRCPAQRTSAETAQR